MEFRSNTSRWAAIIAAVAASAVLFWFGNSLNPLWPLMWFAPLPLLLVAYRASWWEAGLAAWAAIMLGSLNMLPYARVIPFPWFSSFAPFALVFAVAVLLFRALVRRARYWSALLAFPAVWVSVFYLQSLTSVNGTAGSLAYTQLNFLPVLQLASLTGPWGISFLLLLFPASLALVWELWRRQPRRARQILGASLGATAAVLLFGAIRLARHTPAQRVRVGLIASDAHGNEGVAASGADAIRLIRAYAAQAQPLAAQGAQVILMPEKIAVYSPSDAAVLDATLQALADQTHATVIAGVVAAVPGTKYNQARLYTPGAAVATYDKHHLLPFLRKDFTLGKQVLVLPHTPAPWGVEICKDMDFCPLARQYGRRGVGLILDPAWDFGLDRTWHGHIAIMRGVEDGFNLAHAAKDGWLTVSDTRGRILAQVSSGAHPFTTLLASVPVHRAPTLYLAWGDWFAWLALALLAFALVQWLRPAAVESKEPNPGKSVYSSR